jgi:hypothetical protein
VLIHRILQEKLFLPAEVMDKFVEHVFSTGSLDEKRLFKTKRCLIDIRF